MCEVRNIWVNTVSHKACVRQSAKSIASSSEFLRLLSRSNQRKLSKDMFQTDPLSREENMTQKCHKRRQISE